MRTSPVPSPWQWLALSFVCCVLSWVIAPLAAVLALAGVAFWVIGVGLQFYFAFRLIAR